MSILRNAACMLLLVAGGAAAAEPEPSGLAPDAGPTATEPAATAASEAATSGAGPRPPYELTRSLQALQDQIALGSEAARSALRALLTHVGEQLAAADPDVWREPANARAAIVYVLSGGRPQLLHRLIQDEQLAKSERDLAQGALAYATGRRDEAWSFLEGVDARALPPSLGAHVALVQASLTMETDRERAVEYLETARLLAPGTLIEEAALRRQLSVASALADAESFMSLARQYVRRYPRSLYASNFLRAFPELWVGLDLPGDADAFARLESTVAGVAPDDRRDLYLALSRNRLVAGDIDIARSAAMGASALAEAGSAAAVRAGLYEAAAQVASDETSLAVGAIEAIDPVSLSEEDARLRAAALAVADQVRRPPESAKLPGGDTGDLEASEVLDRGRQVVAAADALLEKTR